MSVIRKIDSQGSQPLLRKGEFGMDLTPGSATEKGVFVGTGTENIQLLASSGSIGANKYQYVVATIADRDALSATTDELAYVEEDGVVYNWDGAAWQIYVDVVSVALEEAMGLAIALG